MKSQSASVVWLLVGACLAVLGCSGAGSGGGSGSSLRSIKLQGSGASFPAPLYTRWFQEYSKATPGMTIDFQAKGSGAGIKDFIAGTVDFAASDAAMEPEEIAQVDGGVVLLPMTAGKVVLAYNLPGGPPELKLSREAYTKILMGQVTRWNDPLIVACNDGFSMPSTDITVVVRSDSSGTTFVFSMHLSAISQQWADAFGTNKTINWPSSDKFVKGPKNDGVTALIKQTPGSIGYVEYGFAMQTGQGMATLENKAGRYVRPTLESGKAALASAADMPEDLIVWLPDPEGDDSYPIVTYTWMLCYKQYADPLKAEALKGVLRHCLIEGQKISGDLGYIPLPENVVQVVQAAVDTIQ
jgi:phosphate transport system substrate-binding protein